MLSRLLKKKQITKNASISILGPSKAGKTTFVRYLESGLIQEEAPLPTLGIDYRRKPVKVDGWAFNIIDVGGQKLYQEAFWELAVEQSQGLIYMVDATKRPNKDPEEFQIHLNQFNYALDLIQDHIPILFLLNKQDMKQLNPIQPEEFGKLYSLKRLFKRTCSILPSSAKYGDGVEEAMMWFIEAISEKVFQ
ncbi:MAG: ADP-ribosylation factor-like protein [Candidatus Hermodarchaeota archaeon]